jgi:hypothetical protein
VLPHIGLVWSSRRRLRGGGHGVRGRRQSSVAADLFSADTPGGVLIAVLIDVSEPGGARINRQVMSFDRSRVGATGISPAYSLFSAIFLRSLLRGAILFGIKSFTARSRCELFSGGPHRCLSLGRSVALVLEKFRAAGSPARRFRLVGDRSARAHVGISSISVMLPLLRFQFLLPGSCLRKCHSGEAPKNLGARGDVELLSPIFVERFEKFFGTSNNDRGSCHGFVLRERVVMSAHDGAQRILRTCERQSHAIAHDARFKIFGEFGEVGEFGELFARCT